MVWSSMLVESLVDTNSFFDLSSFRSIIGLMTNKALCTTIKYCLLVQIIFPRLG